MSNDRQTCADQILKAIDYGKLPANETEARLRQMIQDELSRAEQSESGKTRVELCNSLLWQLYTRGEVRGIGANDDEMKARIEKGYTRRRRRKRLMTRTMISLTAALVLLVGLTAAGVIFPYRWFTGESTEDEQQYILQGHEISIQTISEAIAEHERSGNISFKAEEISELVDFLGFDPGFPQKFDCGYSFDFCTCLVASNRIMMSYTYKGDDLSPDFTVANIRSIYFNSMEEAYLSLEQDEEGEMINICGVNIYRYTNVDWINYSWTQDNQFLAFSTPDSQEIAEKCVEEMIRYLKGK